MKTIRIVLFDDDEFVRQSMQIVFEDQDHLKLVGSFTNALNVLSDIESCAPDVVLMDIEMPGRNGIEAVQVLREAHEDLPVLMLTQFDEEDKVIQSISAGANGYLLKTTPGEEMVRRIEELFGSESHIDPEVARKFLDMFSASFSLRTGRESNLLTEQEKAILLLLEEGKDYDVIAKAQGMSHEDVREHIRCIYEKLNVSSVSGAVAIAMNQHPPGKK
jgi:DNA-binding NarL/FixJ family response regulator